MLVKINCITICVVNIILFELHLADSSYPTPPIPGTDKKIKCPHRWLPGPDGGSCYRFWPESSKSWDSARKTCQLYDAELLKFDSVAEKICILLSSDISLETSFQYVSNGMSHDGIGQERNELLQVRHEFVIKEVMKYSVDNEWWIGLKRNSTDIDTWVWTDGSQRNESDNFLQWGHDEPNNFRGQEDCAEIWDNLLNDKNCRQLLQFICERPIDTPSMCDVDNGWDNHGSNTCYKFFDEKLTLQEARLKCFDNDADLLVISGEQEQEILTDFIRHENKSSTWLKLSLKQTSLASEEFQWTWNSSYPLATSWWISEPENDKLQNKSQLCSMMVSNTTGYNNWDSVNCASKNKVMCMKSKGITCPDGYRLNDGRCYIVHFVEPRRWIDAKSYCTLRGTELVKIKSEYQRDFVTTLLKSRGDTKKKIWISLKGGDSSWVWDSGDTLGIYEQFQLAKVNGSGCVFMTLNGQWNIADCNDVALPVCSLPGNHPVIPMRATSASRYACPHGFMGPVDGQCYRLGSSLLDWASARQDCQQDGSDLAVFHSLDSYIYIREMVQENVWIGLNDRSREGKHRWLDQENMNVGSFWKDITVLRNISIGGVFSENCVAMYNQQGMQQRGKLFDTPCCLQRKFLCSRKGELNIAIGTQGIDPSLYLTTDGNVDLSKCHFAGQYQMDLGASFSIKQIVIYINKVMCPFCQDAHFLVYISSSLCQNSTCLVETDSRWEDEGIAIISLRNMTHGRYLFLDSRDQFGNTMRSSFCEVQVYEDTIEVARNVLEKPESDGECFNGWVQDDSGICYYKGEESLSWADADSTCRSMNANLAMPIGSVADKFITDLFKSDLKDGSNVIEAWLGASILVQGQSGWTTVSPSQIFKQRLDALKGGGLYPYGQTLCALLNSDYTLDKSVLKENKCLDRKPFVCQYSSSVIKLETKYAGLHTNLKHLGRNIEIDDSALKFQIKGLGGAKVLLNISSTIVEVKICTIDNKKSAILVNGKSVKAVWISGLCNDTEFKSFYVSWKYGKVGQGSKVGDDVFMTWDVYTEQDQNAELFISSLSSNPIIWKFKQELIGEKPDINGLIVPEVNLALGKPTSQSSLFANSDKSSSDNAVDGCVKGFYSSGCCTHTKFDQDPYWEVDLGQTHAIKEIIIYRRTECCEHRLYNFTVTLSYIDRSGIKHEEQVYQQKGRSVANMIRIATPGKKARTVTIRIPGRKENLELCEVKVIEDTDTEHCGSDDWHAVQVDGKPTCVYLSEMKLSASHAKEYCKDHKSTLGFPESPQLQLILYDIMFQKNMITGFPDIWVQDFNSVSPMNAEKGQCKALGIQHDETQWIDIACSKENIFFCQDQVLTTTTALTSTTSVVTTETTTTTVLQSNVSCDSGWTRNPTNQACYKFVSGKLNFYESMLDCLKIGARLADIANDDEQTFITEMLKTSPSYSKGSWDQVQVAGIELAKEGHWSWYLSDTPWFEGIKWSPGQPDDFKGIEDCAGMRLNKANFGQFNDRPCASNEGVEGHVCKKGPKENICPENWFFDAVDNGCYSISYQKMSWKHAESLCEASGGQLTSITSQAELNFINAIQEKKERFWVGATYKSGDDWFGWLYRSERWSELTVTLDNSLDLRGTNWKLCGAIDNSVLHMIDCEQKNNFICKYTGFKVTTSTTPAITQGSQMQTGQTFSKGLSQITTPQTTGTTIGKTSGYLDSLCGEGWIRNPSTNLCYKISLERTTWDEAQSICVEAAGNLVSIQTMAEQHYLSGVLSGIESLPMSLWTGANNHDLQSGWKWTDDSPFAYFNWQPLQPGDLYAARKNSRSKGCSAINSIKTNTYFGRWDDNPCDSLMGYICKKAGRQRVVETVTEPVPAQDEYYGCPGNGWLEYGNTCFMVVQEKKDWREASDYCRQQSGDLASITNVDEQNFVFSQLPQESYCFNKWENNTECSLWAERGECDHNPVWMAKHCSKDCKTCLRHCRDKHDSFQCTEWAQSGECDKNPDWMIPNCAQSCGVCEGAPTRGYWIGLLRKPYSRTYKWSDHSAMAYTVWSHRQPTDFAKEGKSCGAMFVQTGKWNDGDCAVSLPGFVCKQKKQLLPKTTQSESKSGCEGSNSYGYGPYCYVYIEDEKTWEDAQQDCITKAGSLAVIADVYEQAFVASELANKIEDYWIGLSLTDGKLSWPNDHPMLFTHFDKKFSGVHQLDDSCFAMKKYLGAWQPHDCSISMPYICQTLRDGYTTPTIPTIPSSTPSLPPCAEHWHDFKNHCYYVFTDDDKDWMEAHEYCEYYGASLVSINSEEEYRAVYNLVFRLNPDLTYIHIGLTDRASEGTFVWSDGSPYIFDAFNDGEPNDAGGSEDCVVMFNKVGLRNWNDISCQNQHSFVCKIPKGKPIVNIGSTPTPKYEVCDGDSNWKSFGGDMCYYFENSNLRSWYDAYDDCIQKGGNLASIHSPEEQNSLTLLTKDAIRVTWIGYNRLTWDNQYVWSDSSPVDYTHWHRTQPNDNHIGEKCAVMDKVVGDWHDYNCNDEMSYLCMKHKVGYTPPTTTQPPPVDGGCPDGFSPFGNKCYLLKSGNSEDDTYTYTEAKDICSSYSAELVSIHSPLEQAFLTTKAIDISKGMYIGLTSLRVNEKFEWVDNSRVDFTNWSPGEPSFYALYDSEDCVEMYPNNGEWNDIPCFKKRGLICSRPKDPSLPKKEETETTDGCPERYVKYDDACYKLNKLANTWEASASLCRKDQATLVTILTPHEQAFVEVLIGDEEMEIWTNGKYTDRRGFYWESGEDVTLLLHASSDAFLDNSCMSVKGNKWYSKSCSSRLPSICKFDKENMLTTVPVVHQCRDPTWLLHEGNCYMAVMNSCDYQYAINECNYNGMRLASIHDEGANTAITRYLQSAVGANIHKEFWIGLVGAMRPGQRGPTMWVWSDLSPVSYTNVALDDSSRSGIGCVYMTNSDSFWYISDCHLLKGIICKGKATEVVGQTSTTLSQTSPTGSNATSRTTSVSISTEKMPIDNATSSSSAPWSLPPIGQTRLPSRLAKVEESITDGEIAGIVLGVMFSVIIVAVCAYVIYTIIIKKTRYGVSKSSLGFDNALFHKTDESVSID